MPRRKAATSGGEVGMQGRASKSRRHRGNEPQPPRRRSLRPGLMTLLGALGTAAFIVLSPQALASADWQVVVPGASTPLWTVRAPSIRANSAVTTPSPALDAGAATLAGPSIPPATGPDGAGLRIYEKDLRRLLAEHAPEYADELETIGICESGRWDADAGAWYVRTSAVGDGGRSLGWLQLWEGWPAKFGPHLDPFDPVDAVRLAVSIREARGRFGGAGGWTCADLEGIP